MLSQKQMPFLAVLASLVLGLILALICGEIFLRKTGTYDSWTEQNGGEYASPYRNYDSWLLVREKNYTKSYGQIEYDYRIETNSEGIRDFEHSKIKPDGATRIVVIGDSFCEGQGAPFEKTWTRKLESYLNLRFPQKHFQVVSGGVAGSDPFFGYQLLKKRLLAYQPDVVFLAINTSDVMDAMIFGGMERFLTDGTVQAQSPIKSEWLFAKSRLYRYFLLNVLKYDWLLLSPNEHTRRHKKALEDLVSVARLYDRLAKDHGLSFVTIFHPVAYEVQTGNYLYDFSRVIEDIDHAGIPMVNLLPIFQNRMGSDQETISRYYWPKDGHHNAIGYDLFAKSVLSEIMRQNLILHWQ